MKIETETMPINSYKFRINMELDARELVTLITIFNQISGDPSGPRGFTDELVRKLRAMVPESVKNEMRLTPNTLSNTSLLFGSRSIDFANEWPDNCKGN